MKEIGRRIAGIVDHIKYRTAYKLIVFLLLIFLSFTIVLMSVYYYYFSNSLRKTYIENNTKILNVVSNNLENYIANISQLSLIIRNNNNLINAMIASSYSFQVNDILKLLDYSKMKDLDIQRIEFYIPENNKLYVLDKNDTLTLTTSEDNKTDWYRKLMAEKDYAYIQPVYQPGGSGSMANTVKLVFRRNIINIRTQKSLVTVSIYIDEGIFSREISAAQVYPNEILAVLDSEGTEFYSNLPQPNAGAMSNARLAGLFDSKRATATIDNQNYVVVSGASASGQWRIVKLIEAQAINSSISKALSISLVAVTAFIVIISFSIIFISRNSTKNITKLSEYSKIVAKGNFDVSINNDSKDEIGDLSRQFDIMVRQIQELINEKYILKLSEQNAILNCLQSQINPHFLYNTLQAINGLAIARNQSEIGEMLNALADIFRYSITKKTMTTVYEEVEYINRYLQLCKLRYGKRLNVDYNIDDNVLDYFVPRMILQLLLENSIKYAVEKTTEAVTIGILAKTEEDYLLIQVTDDGPGVTESRLEEIRGSLEHNSIMDAGDNSIGLINLYTQLKMVYNNDVLFHVSSTHRKGFCVSIRIRLKEFA